MMTVEEIIETLGLERHAEGGWFGRMFREHTVSGRPALTAIYYLLEGGDKLPWHKVDAFVVWHYYDGAPAEIKISRNSSQGETLILGRDLAAGQRPQIIVPAFYWHSVVSTGEWTLAGSTVAPGWSEANIQQAYGSASGPPDY